MKNPGMAESPSGQTAGYSVDLVYPSSFVLGQAPLQMQWAAVAAGATVGPLTRPFSYCDLGCGEGSTLCLLAACYPHASFIGIDINAAHIELGRDRAARAGLGNVRFVRASLVLRSTTVCPVCCVSASSSRFPESRLERVGNNGLAE